MGATMKGLPFCAPMARKLSVSFLHEYRGRMGATMKGLPFCAPMTRKLIEISRSRGWESAQEGL
jgi:hypothetical protein